MDLRSAARADTRIYAIGLDVGGPALEVAQRGFSSMLSNRMPQLGRWSLEGGRPEFRLADDLVVHLLERERSSRFERAVIGLAAPVWFGLAERTHLAEVVDPRRRHDLVACSTPAALALGHRLTTSEPFAPQLVLALDLQLGVSASVIEIGPHALVERCTVGVSPRRLRGGAARREILPVSRRRDRALAQLFADATAAGAAGIAQVVVVGDDDPAELERVLGGVSDLWSDVPIEIVHGRGVVAKGAAFLADPASDERFAQRPRHDELDGHDERDGLDGLDDDAQVPTTSDEHVGAGRVAFPVRSVLARRIGVLMDDRDGRPVVHPVIERGAVTPSEHEQLFDLGPDDGSDVYLDLHEQIEPGGTDDPADHRVIATAHLVPGPRPGHEVTVTFSIGVDGRLSLAPDSLWRLEWQAPDVEVLGVRRHLVDRRGPAERFERATVRPLVPTPSPARAEVEPTVEVEVEVEPAADVEVEVEPAADVEVEVESVRSSVAPPPRDAPVPSVAAALQRCERLLSYELGQMVALRSVFALLDLPDDCDVEPLVDAVGQLERSLDERDDALAAALLDAAAATRRATVEGRADWYFGGTRVEVEAEVARVVEHLMVVVGIVSPAEQRRLVRDAQLLGLSPSSARALVHDLVAQAQADRLAHEMATLDDGARTVHLHPELHRFVLDPPPSSSLPGVVDVARRDTLRLRVVLDDR